MSEMQEYDGGGFRIRQPEQGEDFLGGEKPYRSRPNFMPEPIPQNLNEVPIGLDAPGLALDSDDAACNWLDRNGNPYNFD